jgi:hypothetical protein
MSIILILTLTLTLTLLFFSAKNGGTNATTLEEALGVVSERGGGLLNILAAKSRLTGKAGLTKSMKVRVRVG